MIVWRTLSKDFGRLILSIAGVSLSVILMLMMMGIYNGSLMRDVKFVREINTDIFIFPKGISAYYQSSTPIALTSIESIKSIPGVREVTPVFDTSAGLEQDGKIYNLFISGYEPNNTDYGPWAVDSGSRLIGDSQIAIPSSLAKQLHLSVGDSLKLIGIDKSWIIGALVPQGKSFGRNHSWVTQEMVSKIYPTPGYASFAMVKLQNGAVASVVIASIESKFGNLSARTKADQIKVADDAQAESFAPILNMMATVAVVLGTLIVGIVLHSSVNERRRELGVMKAIGFNNRTLAIITYVQALMLVLIGFVIGLGVALIANYLMPKLLDLPISLTITAVWETLALSLAISLLAMIPSVRFISTVYPSEAFK